MTGGFRNPLTGAISLKAKAIIGLVTLIALAIALVAAFQVGYGKGKNISAVQITKYEGNIKALEGKLETANAKTTIKTVTEYVTKTAYQDKIVYKNRDIIHTVIKDRPLDQTVSKGYIYAHNQSALGLPIDFDLASDIHPSGVQDKVVLDVTASNYAKANQWKSQLEALQKWTKETYENGQKVH